MLGCGGSRAEGMPQPNGDVIRVKDAKVAVVIAALRNRLGAWGQGGAESGAGKNAVSARS